MPSRLLKLIATCDAQRTSTEISMTRLIRRKNAYSYEGSRRSDDIALNRTHPVGIDDGLIVILWSCAATYVHAKHVNIRAEMLNSSIDSRRLLSFWREQGCPSSQL